MTFKQRIGKYIFTNLPFSRHVFDHLRLEINAMWVRFLHKISPVYIHKVRNLKQQKNLLVNLGCGPYGKAEGWINLDLYPHPNVFIPADCRKKLILADNSCAGIHIEMFVEHLDPFDELPLLLRECYRTLQPSGVLRIIVPDAEKFIKAYIADGWSAMNEISYGRENWEERYSAKMEALNHVFLQGYEHFGGWDFDRLKKVLRCAGFETIVRTGFCQGNFPQAIIDRSYHKQNGLYVEAVKD